MINNSKLFKHFMCTALGVAAANAGMMSYVTAFNILNEPLPVWEAKDFWMVYGAITSSVYAGGVQLANKLS